MILHSSREQKLRRVTSSSNLIQGSAWIHNIFETINQDFKAQGRCQVLPNFGNSSREPQSYEFSRMRAKFLLCHIVQVLSKLLLIYSLCFETLSRPKSQIFRLELELSQLSKLYQYFCSRSINRVGLGVKTVYEASC